MRRNINKTYSIWVAIVALVLIILLIIWLSTADLTGSTYVAAFIAPHHIAQ